MTRQEVFALLLSTASGFATVLGALFAVAVKRPKRRTLAAALGLSGGVMAAVSLLDLLPQAVAAAAFEMTAFHAAAACTAACAAGMLAARLLELFAEPCGDHMLRIGIFAMLSIMAHNIPEGMAVFLSTGANEKTGLRLAAAIALHNIPEGIAVAMPVLAAAKRRAPAVALAALSGAAEPLGAVLSYLFLRPVLATRCLSLMFCGIAGLMTAIAFLELLPEAFEKQNREAGALGALAGVLLMLINCCISA